MKIIINGSAFDLDTSRGTLFSYYEIVKLSGRDPDKLYTVTWSLSNGGGCITYKDFVSISEGIIFNVAYTSSS